MPHQQLVEPTFACSSIDSRQGAEPARGAPVTSTDKVKITIYKVKPPLRQAYACAGDSTARPCHPTGRTFSSVRAEPISCRTRSGDSGSAVIATLSGASASATAFAIAAPAPELPPSPTPLTPSGLSGVGVSSRIRVIVV